MIAIPLHWTRKMRRGFNQSQDLLVCLRALMADGSMGSTPASPSATLRRARRTATQVGTSRAERLARLNDVFEVRGNLNGKAVVLIDDVCTTGATGSAAADALLAAGATHVHLWCLARTPPH